MERRNITSTQARGGCLFRDCFDGSGFKSSGMSRRSRAQSGLILAESLCRAGFPGLHNLSERRAELVRFRALAVLAPLLLATAPAMAQTTDSNPLRRARPRKSPTKCRPRPVDRKAMSVPSPCPRRQGLVRRHASAAQAEEAGRHPRILSARRCARGHG